VTSQPHTVLDALRGRTHRVEATLGFGIHVRGQGALQQHMDMLLEMNGLDCPDDVRVQGRMGTGEAYNKLHGRHTFEQVIEVCVLLPVPLHSGLLPLAWRALGSPASNDDTGACLGSGRDERLVLALGCRVGNLEYIEHTHGNMVREVGRCHGGRDQVARRVAV
jgi:hypothetical protein